MNNFKMSRQNITNLQLCSLYEIKSKGINENKILSHVCYREKSKSGIIIDNVCSLDKSE